MCGLHVNFVTRASDDVYFLFSDSLSEVASDVGRFHACRSLASFSETAAPHASNKHALLRRLSEPIGRLCTCPSVCQMADMEGSVCHMTDMEGTITFVVPELSEKTIMNVSVAAWPLTVPVP